MDDLRRENCVLLQMRIGQNLRAGKSVAGDKIPETMKELR